MHSNTPLVHIEKEGYAHVQGAVLGGGHGLQGPGAPAGQLAALRGVMPQLRILLDCLHHAPRSH